jgi:hypothetical protein
MSKGGSSSSITDNLTLTLAGGTHIDTDLDNIRVNNIAPITVNSNLAVTQPIVTNSTSKSDSTAGLDLKVEPLKVSSDSTSAVDIKPLAIDSCQTIKLAPLPPIHMEQPYSHHFGVTFMGMELWGFSMSGKSEMCLTSPAKPKHFNIEVPEPGQCGCCGEAAHAPKGAPNQPKSGLRVRVK